MSEESEEWRVKSGNSAVFTHIFQFIAEGDTFTPNSTRYIVTERAQRMWDDCQCA